MRHYVLGGVALAGGSICALVPMTGKLANIGLFLAVVGGVWLAWGILVFVRFLQRHSVLEEGAGGAGA
ncbi:MAG: hypothetical protein PVG25_02715 [Anaerolineae bacterium]